MKRKMKKLFVLFMAFVMMLSLTACDDKKASVGKSSGDSSLLISEEPIELTAFIAASAEPDGQWPMFKKAAEMTNVFAKCNVSKSNSDMTQAFNLMLASGEIDDLVFAQKELTFIKYAMDGAFVPLNEYFHLMPNVKKFMDEHPVVKKNITASDGNIYYLPVITCAKAKSGWFVRQDWMDKLGLELPRTAEDVYNVLTAFKTQDPNGNGKADEVPYFSYLKLEELFGLWDARKDWYLEKGEVKYGPMQPKYKTAMKNLIKWYSEGLFDTEVVTASSSNRSRDRLLNDNVGGMTYDYFASTARFNDTLQDKIPGFEFLPFAPPEDIVLHTRGDNVQYGWGVYSGTKYLEEAVKYLDFWWSEEGGNLVNFGEEGVHWEMVDGKPQFTEELLSLDNPKAKIMEYGCQRGFGYIQDFAYERQWMNDIGYEGMKMYDEGNWYVEQLPPVYLQLSQKELEQYNRLKTQIDTHSDEYYQKWILGALDFDKTYDSYLKELEKLGIKELTKLYNKAYERYMKIK